MNKSQFCIHIAIQGVSHKEAKNSSVKKLLVVGAVPDAAENYFNMKTMLNKVDIEALEFMVAADIKMCTYSILLV